MFITDHQRQVLIEDALAANRVGRDGGGEEAPYADVIADLATGREVADRDLLVQFLWRRVTVAAEAGLSRKEHWVWSAAVLLLDQLGENLDDIFSGATESVTKR